TRAKRACLLNPLHAINGCPDRNATVAAPPLCGRGPRDAGGADGKRRLYAFLERRFFPRTNRQLFVRPRDRTRPRGTAQSVCVDRTRGEAADWLLRILSPGRR